LGIVLILAVCFTSVPYVINKCFVTATCLQQLFHSKIKGARYTVYECVLYSKKYGKLRFAAAI